MSQIGSSSGVRVAAQPLSNVYTVLLLIGGLALALTLVVLCITMNARYGTILGVSEEGKQAKAAPDAAKSRQNAEKARLQEVEEQLKRFPEGVTGTAPAVGGAPAEAAPAEAAPAEAAPAEAAPAEAAPAEAAPAEAAPAEAAPAEAAPAEAAPAEAAPAEAAPAEAAPAEATPAEDTPAEAAPADK